MNNLIKALFTVSMFFFSDIIWIALHKMFSNFLLYGSWLVAKTRILLNAAEMELYIAIQLLTQAFRANLECDTTR